MQLAAMAEGNTSPNPLVGAVVVHDGVIIGEGYHLRVGTPHAEAVALARVREHSLLHSSTLYVNLEPCSHHGRTPPCSDLIIQSGIRRVVTGTGDPDPKVAGNGIRRLREAGVEVITGVEEERCRWLNRRYFTWHEKKRPYVILKWARSADGFIDIIREKGTPRSPTWITGKAERVLVHRWRAAEDAIMAGGATIRADNPQLTVRDWSGENPVRVVVSKSGNIDREAAIFDRSAKSIIFTANRELSFPGCEHIILRNGNGYVEEILKELYDRGVQSLFVEGGASVTGSFVRAGVWDEARRFTGTQLFKTGIAAPLPDLIAAKTIHFERSILEIAYHF